LAVNADPAPCRLVRQERQFGQLSRVAPASAGLLRVIFA
jgi:hypothetical protein